MGDVTRSDLDEGELDDAIRRLVDAAGADAPEPPLLDGHQLVPTMSVDPGRRWHTLAIAAVVVIVVVGVLAAVVISPDGDVAAPGQSDSTAPPPSTQDASPAVSTTPGGPTAPTNADVGASRPIVGTSARRCVETYDLDTLSARTWAFDGTVTDIGASIDGAVDTRVTFDVHEWFAIDGPATVTVDLAPPRPGSSVQPPEYDVGSRLLVSGEPRRGGQPLDAPVAWLCGFTRTRDPSTASAWRAVFAADPAPTTSCPPSPTSTDPPPDEGAPCPSGAEDRTVDVMAAWPAPPAVEPDLEGAPRLLPNLGTDVTVATSDYEQAGGRVVYEQVFARSGPDAAVVEVMTIPGRLLGEDELVEDLGLGAWDVSFAGNRSARSMSITLADPSGIVVVRGDGLERNELLDIAEGLRRRSSDVAGWDLPLAANGLIAVLEGWGTAGTTRTVSWSGGGEGGGELLVFYGSPSGWRSPLTDPTIEIDDVNGAPHRRIRRRSQRGLVVARARCRPSPRRPR